MTRCGSSLEGIRVSSRQVLEFDPSKVSVSDPFVIFDSESLWGETSRSSSFDIHNQTLARANFSIVFQSKKLIFQLRDSTSSE